VAGELAIPLLKDLPLVSSLDANLAGRYTDYSTSGSVETWKVGPRLSRQQQPALPGHHIARHPCADA
jgi:hypothetical protein